MAGAHSKIGNAAWDLVPGPLRSKLQSEAGKRFMRFVPVSLAALASSQITLAALVGIWQVTAGVAAFVASIVGAGVSYVLSRWAWERKGRPDLLRETLPFWAVSVCVWVILAWANKLGVHLVGVWGLHKGWKKVVVENGTYFLANCVTFVARFLIFHYVLFAERGKSPASVEADAEAAVGSAPGTEELPLEPAEDFTR